jgi:hypothetical protein
MLTGLNQANIKNTESSRPAVTLLSPAILQGNKNAFTPDSLKLSTAKSPAFKLTSPFQLFSLGSSPGHSNSGLTIQWDKQFYDPSVANGSPPPGYVSAGSVKEIPQAKVVEAAVAILHKNQPLGTSTPVNIDGWSLLAVDQNHTWTFRNGRKVDVPGGLHGVTVYLKKN